MTEPEVVSLAELAEQAGDDDPEFGDYPDEEE